MILQLKRGEANLRPDDDSQILLDGEGRITGLYEETRLIRRSYDDRWLSGPRPERGRRDRSHRDHEVLDAPAIDAAIARAHALFDRALHEESRLEVVEALNREDPAFLEPEALLRRARGWSREDYARDGARFRELVGAIPVLPPDHYRSLYVLVSQGCRYNKCLFCELYRDRGFRTLSPSEVARQVEDLVAFFGAALATRTSVFLGDASGLAVPQADLLEMLATLQDRLPESLTASGFHTFLDVFVTKPRSVEELAALRERGLRRVYIGLESASEQVLEFFRKPNALPVLEEEVRKTREAGIHCALMVLAGGAGRQHQREHVERTVEFVGELGLTGEDRVFLSPLVLPEGTGFREQAKEAGMELLEPEEIEEEIRALREGLSRCASKVSRYELRNYLYR